ncbi:hypothetical protein Moror_11191 [Moniliophthora roreri MCA 2997]|uniref:Uncharacterized protein n=1 Tax=Moniliophthora roreri (strain MCA 2997) TaxID=1381753 RepID=V2XTC8_MONRO|nr:hypothetical protein Moror_11191 [Moniliophthora roreri MCA 2997]
MLRGELSRGAEQEEQKEQKEQEEQEEQEEQVCGCLKDPMAECEEARAMAEVVKQMEDVRRRGVEKIFTP